MKTTSIRCLGALLVLFLNLSVSSAQVRLGVAGGVNIAKLTFDNFDISGSAVTSNGETNVRLALPIEIGLGLHFALQPEVVYSRQGTYYRGDSRRQVGNLIMEDSEAGNFHYTTLEIPVLAKYKFGKGKFKVHLAAGPSVAMNIDGKMSFKGFNLVRTTSGGVVSDFFYAEDYGLRFTSDGFDWNDIGNDEFAFAKLMYNAHFGGGLEFNFGRVALFLDARYILGLSDLFPDAQDSEETWSAKQRGIGLGLGMFIALGGQ